MSRSLVVPGSSFLLETMITVLSMGDYAFGSHLADVA